MRYSIATLGLFLCSFIGCGTVNFVEPVRSKTKNKVFLGSIGSEKAYLLQNEFNNSAIPSIAVPILLDVHLKYFTASTYKRFLEAKSYQNVDLEVDYVDSLPDKPQYLQLKIADKVSLISSLNALENSAEKDYLKNNKGAITITGVSGAFNAQEFEILTNADALFLKQTNPKQFVIQTYKDGEPQETLGLGNAILFEYSTVNCCWKENDKHQIDIVDLVSVYNTCPNNTYRSSKKAERKISHLKF